MRLDGIKNAKIPVYLSTHLPVVCNIFTKWYLTQPLLNMLPVKPEFMTGKVGVSPEESPGL